jgi:S-formylglutathione hydrolase
VMWGRLVIGLVAPIAGALHAQTKGSFERIKVHGKSLEGNLEGDSPDRDVSIYLPPSYARVARGEQRSAVLLEESDIR